ncbi:Helicase conserved C-terminal domain-containing protein [Streptomyces sp. WMMB 714]|uniref:DEAD/DEAH box helicase n=1 Tax=Streptomyces sp. WMMB 714 TaxID=1286822 RepID=UPI0005F78045|nr:DEAD/DEAH box helicase [Streptomyces sp. WMMB 714]SCK04848.1 Helicase conserved C-terminal domain-containing protein [Streptomyces sp. WMMB 714]SCK51043.1 Helicase conserved C-terminal domain-containing protein [Streptomyces sp. WMMB 714]
MARVQLRKHQREALDAIISALELPVHGDVPSGGLRATVIAAPGSGKTLIAAEAARRLVPGGRVLVLVPTLDLLTQTVEAWQAAGHRGKMIAVCSLSGDTMLGALGVRATTSAPQLALWAGSGPVVVFATYASLAPQEVEDGRTLEGGEPVPGVLERALQGVYGQKLEGFDLAVVDEAHRTSGDAVKAWAAIHDNARVPAVRRLYMTATARVWEVPASPGRQDGAEVAEVREGASGGFQGRVVASMDDEALYGPQVFTYGLMEAQERGTLAPFVVDVLEIRDPEAGPAEGRAAGLEEVRGRRLAALQAALLKHTDTTGVRSLMTFHHRTLEAMAFARALPETAAELHGSDPLTYPERVGSDWLSGQHTAGERRAVLDRFANGWDAEGWKTAVSFLASCRVLGEGVDIRGERGVGGVVFADTRSSAVDIVQNIGRALRQDPGEGKVARIIVPIFLAPGENPQNMTASPSYRPLVAVLQGLRSHEEAIIERLVLHSRPTRSGTPDDVRALDPHQPADHGGTEPDEDERDGSEGDAAGSEPGSRDGAPEAGAALLQFSTPRDPDVIASFLRTRVLRPESEVWLTGYNALRRWVAEHGHAQVPLHATIDLTEHEGVHEGEDAETEKAEREKADGGREESAFALGSWVSEQRRQQREGVLRPWRGELLDELGMVWSVHDIAFWRKLTAARDYYAVAGTLAAPKNAIMDDVAIGQALANFRKPGGLGKDPVRAAQRRAELEAIDPDWNPTWPIPWQRHWAKVRQCLDGGAALEEIRPGVHVGGEDIGTWLTEQATAWHQLSPGQREKLTELGIQAPEDTAGKPERAAGRTLLPAEASTWEKNLTALRQFHQREGHSRVPRQHREPVMVDDGTGTGGYVEHQVRLGVWRSNTRSRRTSLPAELEQQLADLGLFN